MANEEHLAILRQGVDVWNAWRLQILEDQQARMGTLTPPHVIMEIEDLRKELGENEG